MPDGIDILDSLRNADLKDYCRDAIIDIDNSRFAKVDRPNGRCSIFKKSTIVWLAENSCRKLSNDRTFRVMQSTNFLEKQKTIVQTVEKRRVILGDWCLFYTQDKTSFLLGNVLQFSADESNSKKSIFEWDGNIQGIRALCMWYQVQREGGIITGKLIEIPVFCHGFHPLQYYICSVPPPCFLTAEESRILSFDNATVEQITKFFQKSSVSHLL